MNNDQPTHRLPFEGEPDSFRRREWLLSNGTGAYAMGTALGCNTRRYHGLLIAASQPPVGRIVSLNQVFEQLWLTPKQNAEAAPQVLELMTGQFMDDRGHTIDAPRGFAYLQQFERGLSVQWTYGWGAVQVTRQLLLHDHTQAATVRYTVAGLQAAGYEAQLRLSPMMSLRDFHAVLREPEHGAFEVDDRGDAITVHREAAKATLSCPGSQFTHEPAWWYQFFYAADADRGQDEREDLFVPGFFEQAVSDGTSLSLTVSLGGDSVEPIANNQAKGQRLDSITRALEPVAKSFDQGIGATSLEDESPAPGELLQHTLAVAADDFVVKRPLKGQNLSTILAGYPWFADWGRDTFIALPGLLLTTGRLEEAAAVLRVFAEAIDQGLVPNRFDDYTEAAAHYNTVDASLWFIEAALQYLQASGDQTSWNDWLAQACMAIVDAYEAGTGRDAQSGQAMIKMDPADGLIAAGSNETQLTWMDAACGGVVFTPRPGKAVEINALWHNALAGLAKHLPKSQAKAAKHYQALAARVQQHFTDTFWSEPAGYLFDHVALDEAGQPAPDPSLRPNQLFACSLPRSPLPQEKQQRVVQAAQTHLLTPGGLRTLPRDDPNYHGQFRGDQFQRDKAYHQGTIWPWLIGPYGEGVLRSHQFSRQAKQHVAEALTPLMASLVDGAATTGLQPGPVGQLPELYEAEPDGVGRHRPVGCIAQAWSVSELLRVAALLT
jgi:predicted glycogen debranching enzyme